MPLYELFCIAVHTSQPTHLKSLITTCANHVMESGGIARKLHYFGAYAMPQPKTRQGIRHNMGDYWLMHFDSNPTAMHALGRRIRKDPLVLRWNMSKLSDKVEDSFWKKAKTVSLNDSIESASLRNFNRYTDANQTPR